MRCTLSLGLCLPPNETIDVEYCGFGNRRNRLWYRNVTSPLSVVSIHSCQVGGCEEELKCSASNERGTSEKARGKNREEMKAIQFPLLPIYSTTFCGGAHHQQDTFSSPVQLLLDLQYHLQVIYNWRRIFIFLLFWNNFSLGFLHHKEISFLPFLPNIFLPFTCSSRSS